MRSQAFPPAHTGRESFPLIPAFHVAIKKFHTAGHPSTAYYHGFTGTKPALSPEQNEVIGLSFSFITVHCRIWLPVPGFPCSNSPIFPYSRRPLLYSCQLAAACNGTRSFLGTGCTQPHWPPLSGALHFYSFPYRSVNSKIRQCFTHTGHSYFIDIPAYQIHNLPPGYFRGLCFILTVSFSCLQRASHSPSISGFSACRSINVGVSGRYPIIPPIGELV